ncbi:restriction endonuclease [Litorivicinus sp.]|nr:restriction endonuclease [Litorivicinus sp.]
MSNFDLQNDSVPQLIQGMMYATVIGLEALGRSGSNAEIDDKVAELEGLSEDDQQILMPNGQRARFNYFMAWARTHLRKAGIIESQGRALWAIKSDAVLPESREKCVEIYQITEANRRMQYKKNAVNEKVTDDFQEAMDWHEQLLSVLKAMAPDAFERLAQRILRESGFSRVKVLGKTHDGGLDGVGVLRVNLLSFHVYFQCKRYQGSVGSKEIRDFRGALEGRATQGLFITTGTFTSEAQKEATRDGAKPIELIDGDALCELLEELQLGVKTAEKIVKEMTIYPEFFGEL